MTQGHDISVLNTLITGFAAFAATNIDDLFVLTMFFSQTGRGLRKRQIVAGQYLGFTALLGISLIGFFGGRMLPQAWMGCLGVVPVWIGVRRWFNRNKQAAIAGTGPVSTASVALVVFANGGDNIGTYAPLFANCDVSHLVITLVTFQILLGVWCLAANAISHHPAVAPALARYGHIIVPFVLVGLGVEVIVETGAFRLFGL